MDHVTQSYRSVAATVNPVIGGPSTPLALQEFSLISFDNSGYRQPLPPGLGDLPLYPDDDGYFSINGSLDSTDFSPQTTLASISHDNQSTFNPMITDILGFPAESPHVTPDPHSAHLNADTVCSGSRARSESRRYCCREPGCTWRSSFPTKQALDRHHEVKHLDKHVDCPIPGCERVGDKGIKRKDNLPAHIWNKHK
ncbi:hypothetical protein B9Z19DRAFT_1110520, partial [Tuber borchii]